MGRPEWGQRTPFCAKSVEKDNPRVIRVPADKGAAVRNGGADAGQVSGYFGLLKQYFAQGIQQAGYCLFGWAGVCGAAFVVGAGPVDVVLPGCDEQAVFDDAAE